jgi:hypothetical protein
LKNNRATSFRCLRAGRESKILKLFPAGGDHGVRDFMVALDGATGKLVCRKYVIPAPGEPGSETWKDKNNAWQTGGGAMWVTGSYDAAANQVLWGIGNPVPMYEPGVLDVCKAARKTFETVGCVVEEAQPPVSSMMAACACPTMLPSGRCAVSRSAAATGRSLDRMTADGAPPPSTR